MEITKLIVDLLGTLIWPVTIVLIILMFRKQITSRLKDIETLELPGGFKTTLTKVNEIVSTSVQLKEEKIEPGLTEDSFLLSPSDSVDISIFNLRLNIEREVSRIIQLSPEWQRTDTRSLGNKVDILHNLGWIDQKVYDGLIGFVEVTNDLFQLRDKINSDLRDLFNIGSTIYYHIRYIRIVRALIDSFNGNMLWSTDKGVKNKKYHFYSAIASEAERFEYS